jgi:hypothetical protein
MRGERNDIFRTRQSSLDLHLPWLDDQWASGCRNGAELWRRLAARGFRGSLRVISEWATRRRRAETTKARPEAAPALVYVTAPGDGECLDLSEDVFDLSGIIVCDTSGIVTFTYKANNGKWNRDSTVSMNSLDSNIVTVSIDTSGNCNR